MQFVNFSIGYATAGQLAYTFGLVREHAPTYKVQLLLVAVQDK
jgi:hypothetical protein